MLRRLGRPAANCTGRRRPLCWRKTPSITRPTGGSRHARSKNFPSASPARLGRRHRGARGDSLHRPGQRRHPAAQRACHPGAHRRGQPGTQSPAWLLELQGSPKRGRGRCLPQPSPGRRRDDQGQGLRRLPRTARPRRYRRRGRGHPRPLARADRQSGRPGGQGRLCGKTPRCVHRGRPPLPQALWGKGPHLPVRHPAAEHETLPLGLRVGPQRADRRVAAHRGDRPQRRQGWLDRGDSRAQRPGLLHVAWPRPSQTLHGQPLQPARHLLDLRLFDRLPGRLGRPPAGYHGLGQRRRSVGPDRAGGERRNSPGGTLRYGLQLGPPRQIGQGRVQLHAGRRLDQVYRARRLGAGPPRRDRRPAQVAARIHHRA